jgi:hypothetical protein
MNWRNPSSINLSTENEAQRRRGDRQYMGWKINACNPSRLHYG